MVAKEDAGYKFAEFGDEPAGGDGGGGGGFRYVVWNENPEKVDICLALEPVCFSSYQRIQGAMKELVSLY